MSKLFGILASLIILPVLAVLGSGSASAAPTSCNATVARIASMPTGDARDARVIDAYVSGCIRLDGARFDGVRPYVGVAQCAAWQGRLASTANVDRRDAVLLRGFVLGCWV